MHQNYSGSNILLSFCGSFEKLMTLSAIEGLTAEITSYQITDPAIKHGPRLIPDLRVTDM